MKLIFSFFIHFASFFKPIKLSLNSTNINYPFGDADVQTVAPAAAVTLTIKNQLTHVEFTPAMAAGMTVNFVVTPGLKRGARVRMKALSDGTARTVTPGTGATGTAEAGVISKTKELTWEFDGTNFELQSARQID